MRAEMESSGSGDMRLNNPGVKITSETPEEAVRLTAINNGHGALVSWARLDGGMIEIVVAPTPEN